MPDPISYRVCSSKTRASKAEWRRLWSGYDVDKLRLMDTKKTGSWIKSPLFFFVLLSLSARQFAGDELHQLAWSPARTQSFAFREDSRWDTELVFCFIFDLANDLLWLKFFQFSTWLTGSVLHFHTRSSWTAVKFRNRNTWRNVDVCMEIHMCGRHIWHINNSMDTYATV